MKFLLDQDVYAATSRFLTDLGHDVVRAAEIGLSQAADKRLLSVAAEQGRILITRDRDFGALVFVNALGSGVLYLRLLPSTLKPVHSELARVLKLYDEGELRKVFIVIEADGHRLRRLPTE
ncbi:MAG: DUF5615 family PIN-like protein [Sedimentisphaerales bacterium]|nr:DUF5615 family PIN-like protein [Sedimentisphaerales bacterium]